MNKPVFDVEEHLRHIPQYSQTQRATQDQVRDLIQVANRLGLYDAADLLKKV